MLHVLMHWVTPGSHHIPGPFKVKPNDRYREIPQTNKGHPHAGPQELCLAAQPKSLQVSDLPIG
jgi:hypothetical protein